jgi:hypothetical protein
MIPIRVDTAKEWREFIVGLLVLSLTCGCAYGVYRGGAYGYSHYIKKWRYSNVILLEELDREGAGYFWSKAASEPTCHGLVISESKESHVPLNELPGNHVLIYRHAPFSEPEVWDAVITVNNVSPTHSVAIRENDMATLVKRTCEIIQGVGATRE